MAISLSSDDELKEFAAMCQWLRVNQFKIRSTKTAKKKPPEVLLYLIDKRTKQLIEVI